MFDELNYIITDEDIRRLNNQLKMDGDKILNDFFIHGAVTLLPYLYVCF